MNTIGNTIASAILILISSPIWIIWIIVGLLIRLWKITFGNIDVSLFINWMKKTAEWVYNG